MADFNMNIDPDVDKETARATFHDSGRAELFDWMINLGLIDVWHLKNPYKLRFTSPTSNNRIYNCLVSIGFTTSSFEILSSTGYQVWLRGSRSG